jgi:hypothetical protein
MARSRPTRGHPQTLPVPDLGAAESGRRETAVAEMFGTRINGTMPSGSSRPLPLNPRAAISLRLEPDVGQ